MNFPTRARGSALIAAIFLIVVIAVLGAFAVRIGMAQQETVNLSLLGDRALAAANTGVQWGAYQALHSNCASGPTTLNLTQAGLNGFRVNVTCNATSHTDGIDTLNMYSVEAVAEYAVYGTPDYAYRKISASFTDAN